MRTKYLILATLLCSAILFAAPQVAADEQAEIILRALINAGVISQSDIDAASAEVKRERRTQEAALPASIADRVTVLESKTKDVPHWIKTFKVKGDLRLRNELEVNEQGEDNNRQRLRFRIGATSNINDQVKVGFGIATGSSDSPTSTNQTLEQEFQSKSIWLDYAYAEYKPKEWLKFLGGKFKSPFMHTDMLWDGDIRFDGFSAKATHTFFEDAGDLPETKGFVTLGYFPLDDAPAGEGDLFLTAVQTGAKVKLAKDVKLKSAVALYNFHNLEGYASGTLAEDKGTNTSEGTGSFIANDFNVISPIVKLTLNDLFGYGVPVTFTGEYADNLAIENDKNDNAWRAGVQLGNKAKKKGDWRWILQYSRLEADAFFDAFPDGDFNDGGTNAKGWETILEYAIVDNIILGLDYYSTETITGTKGDDQIVQGDILFKF